MAYQIRALSRPDWQQQAEAIAQADPTFRFTQLIDAAKINPSRDLCFADWSGVNFSNCRLRGYDFTGARLHGCNFKDARILNFTPGGGSEAGITRHGEPNPFPARFDQAELGRVIQNPDRDPHLPAQVTPIANLRDAADWDEYCHAWKRADVLPDDSHLPTGAIFQDAPFAPEMVVVPPGSFKMGTPEGVGRTNEHRQRNVTIGYRLAIGRFPVTFSEIQMARQRGGLKLNPDDSGLRRSQHAVVDVNWDNALTYCKWLSEATGREYRLLSEAEWEYCCRAGTQTAYCLGDDASGLDKIAWHRVNSGKKTHSVGEKEANAFGLHDMHGNVWEWCADPWHDDYNDDPPNDGSVWDSGKEVRRVVRGGSWINSPGGLRSAYRNRFNTDSRFSYVGFRVASTLSPELVRLRSHQACTLSVQGHA